MKLIHRNFDKNNCGHVKLVPEESEDMWHAYNLVAEGDHLRASTVRKVNMESATGSTSAQKVNTTLTIQVESVDFDSQACVLRVKGRNVVENPYVKMGAYHTIDLELNRTFTLGKQEWDSVAFDRLDLACDPSQRADLAAIVMQEGLAHICLVTSSMTLVRARIENTIPRKKRGSCSQHDKAMHKFYDQVVQGLVRHINFNVVKAVLVASPGFVKEQFCNYMFQMATTTEDKETRALLEHRPKFVMVHSSSGHKQALREVLSDPAVTSKLADTKATGEVKALDAFYNMLQNEPARAFYGINHTERANEAQAIETLLISDSLFRSRDLQTRRRYVKLVDGVRENCGDVKIFSSLHISGEQLNQLSGVAAILRFPMPDLEEEEEQGSSSDDDGT